MTASQTHQKLLDTLREAKEKSKATYDDLASHAGCNADMIKNIFAGRISCSNFLIICAIFKKTGVSLDEFAEIPLRVDSRSHVDNRAFTATLDALNAGETRTDAAHRETIQLLQGSIASYRTALTDARAMGRARKEAEREEPAVSDSALRDSLRADYDHAGGLYHPDGGMVARASIRCGAAGYKTAAERIKKRRLRREEEENEPCFHDEMPEVRGEREPELEDYAGRYADRLQAAHMQEMRRGVRREADRRSGEHAERVLQRPREKGGKKDGRLSYVYCRRLRYGAGEELYSKPGFADNRAHGRNSYFHRDWN